MLVHDRQCFGFEVRQGLVGQIETRVPFDPLAGAAAGQPTEDVGPVLLRQGGIRQKWRIRIVAEYRSTIANAHEGPEKLEFRRRYEHKGRAQPRLRNPAVQLDRLVVVVDVTQSSGPV